MIKVKPGRKIPLVAQITSGDDSKRVKAHLLKKDGSDMSPSGVELAAVIDGLYTDYSVDVPANLDYFNAQMTVYESDGETAATGFDIITESYEVESDDVAHSLVVAVSCEGSNQVSGLPKIVRGENHNLLLALKEDGLSGDPFSLAGITEATFKLKKDDDTVLSKTMSGGAIQAVSVELGLLRVLLTQAETAVLATGETVDAELVIDKGSVRTIVNLAESVAVEDPLL